MYGNILIRGKKQLVANVIFVNLGVIMFSMFCHVVGLGQFFFVTFLNEQIMVIVTISPGRPSPFIHCHSHC